jgi:hypothetical protein
LHPCAHAPTIPRPQVKGDIAVTKRAAYAAEEAVQRLEKEKQRQDFLIEGLQVGQGVEDADTWRGNRKQVNVQGAPAAHERGTGCGIARVDGGSVGSSGRRTRRG